MGACGTPLSSAEEAESRQAGGQEIESDRGREEGEARGREAGSKGLREREGEEADAQMSEDDGREKVYIYIY